MFSINELAKVEKNTIQMCNNKKKKIEKSNSKVIVLVTSNTITQMGQGGRMEVTPGKI